VLKDFHYWSKGTVTLYVSVSAAILFSQKKQKTIVVNHIVYEIVWTLYCTMHQVQVLCAENLD
jgi:hypothetical protein